MPSLSFSPKTAKIFLPKIFSKMLTFYHFPHCPFCQRVRLFLEFKKLEYKSVEIAYYDEEARIKLTGTPLLPVVEFDDGTILGESLDILREIESRFPRPIGFVGPVEPLFYWAGGAACSIPRYFDLLLPVLPDHYSEFQNDEKAKSFFQQKKEKLRGKSFQQLKSERIEIFENNVRPHLEPILQKIEDEFFLMGPTFSVADCVLAADLSALRIVPEIALPPQILKYCERVERKCGFNLLEK